MTSEQMNELTEDQKCVKIAEACGWLNLTGESSRHPYGLMPDGLCRTRVPDYLNDLNACHEMEKSIQEPRERVRYAEELCNIWTGRKDRAIPDWWLIHDATASQRCEAFGKTKGLW